MSIRKPKGRRRLYPMPVEGLLDHPDFIAMPAAGAGIVIRLALHFWSTNCRPLPTADHELRNIGRAHAPTWRHWRPMVLKVFADIEPELTAYFKLREIKGTTIRYIFARGGQMRGANLALKKITDSKPSGLAAEHASGAVAPMNRVDRPRWHGRLPAAEDAAGRARFTDKRG